MNFEHATGIKLPEMTCETTEKGRFYTTPEGNVYPSVTTILGKASDQSWIQQWKDRVGEAEAAKVLVQAGRRGTAVHEICEAYLKNDPDYKKGHMPANIASFNHIKPFLDQHITVVGGLELPLYSDKLRVAGRVDCLAKWNNKLSIIDFKTSKREKKKEDITNYFLQCSAYSYMFYERTGLIAGQIVIVMTVDNSEPLIFVEKASKYLEAFCNIRNSLPF